MVNKTHSFVKERPIVIAITGPTASGKSALAHALARTFSGPIINADSRQIYADLPILTACPTQAERAQADYRLYNTIKSPEIWTAWDWAHQAQAIFQNSQAPIVWVVGGTGLYMLSFFEGLCPIPSISPSTRERVRNHVALNKLDAYAKLQLIDPLLAERLDPTNGQRIGRALEVFEETGKPLSFFFKTPPTPLAPLDLGIILLPERSLIKEKARKRLDVMVEEGILHEVHHLNIVPGHPLTKTIGLGAIQRYLNNTLSWSAVIDKFMCETGQYIKKQTTWFRHKLNPNLWHSAESTAQAKECITQFLRGRLSQS